MRESVEGALVEPPITDEAGGLRDCEDLGVGGRVVGGARLVVSGSDDLALELDHCADRHLVYFPCFDRLVVGVCHVVFGIALEGGWVNLLEWAVFLHGLVERVLDFQCQSASLADFLLIIYG